MATPTWVVVARHVRDVRRYIIVRATLCQHNATIDHYEVISSHVIDHCHLVRLVVM